MIQGDVICDSQSTPKTSHMLYMTNQNLQRSKHKHSVGLAQSILTHYIVQGMSLELCTCSLLVEH